MNQERIKKKLLKLLERESKAIDKILTLEEGSEEYRIYVLQANMARAEFQFWKGELK